MRKLTYILFILLILGLGSCTTSAPVLEKIPDVSVEPIGPIKPPEQAEADENIFQSERDYVTIIAVGDNLFHLAMIQDGEEGDYISAYEEIRHLVEQADIAFINQETLLAGKDFGLSGYPRFNTPQEVGRAIAATGFNIVNHATNHIMDKGVEAVFATMDLWDTMPEVQILGIHRNEEQRKLPVLVTKNNITIGFLSYTYGTNAIPLPKDKPYLVSLINTEIMKEEITNLRPLCDFLLVSMHWGNEYRHNYNKDQETLAAFLAENMVDLVIGHHPHAIQPVEYIKRPDDSTMLCFYSLGNFISSQIQNVTLLGAMAYIKIAKDNGIEITEAGAIPLVTHYEYNHRNIKVYPLYSYTQELLEKHWRKDRDNGLSMDYFTGLASTVFEHREIKSNPFQ